MSNSTLRTTIDKFHIPEDIVHADWTAVCKVCGRVYHSRIAALASVCGEANQLDFVTDELEKCHAESHEPQGS